MAYEGFVPPSTLNDDFNNIKFDVKGALRISQQEIKTLIAELGDPTQALIIDGKKFEGSDKFSTAATLALNNKMESLQNQTTSIISVFSELYKLEKSLTP